MGKKLFDYVIGNPPYQEEVENNGRSNPVYNLFMEAAYESAEVVELITPARFLFNAGQTPKAWNKKMLADEHFKVLQYEPDASKVFQNTEIKGGVAITIRNAKKQYEAIQIFTAFEELNHIIHKVLEIQGEKLFLDSQVSSRGLYRTTDEFFSDFPYAKERLGKGTGNMIASNFFDCLPEVCVYDKPEDSNQYYQFLHRKGNQRSVCYMLRRYVQPNDFVNKYNVACPKSNGNGVFGEILTSTEILVPYEGATDTFISIGAFDTHIETENLQTYIKSKFFRTMLGVKKVTQDNSKSVWSLIPIQDFTGSSDIDWSKPIHEIDLQLYRKYGLDEKEIEFIETHVKEMA